MCLWAFWVCVFRGSERGGRRGLATNRAPNTAKKLLPRIVSSEHRKKGAESGIGRISLIIPSVRQPLFETSGVFLGKAIHGPMPVLGETFEELSGPLVHTNFPRKRYGPMIGPYEFPPKLVLTNGAQSSLKVSVLTGLGP